MRCIMLRLSPIVIEIAKRGDMMRINTNNPAAYGVPKLRPMAPAQKATDANKAPDTSKSSFDAALGQARRDIRKTKDNVTNATGFCMATTMTPVEIILGEEKYEKVESIYDISCEELEPRLRKAATLGLDLDTSGMTEGEIYNAVCSIFEEYLGKDFLEPTIFYSGMGMTSPIQEVFPLNEYQRIHNTFGSVLHRCGAYGHDAYVEAKGFTGMSESEMRTAVRSEYPENMTLKDCLLMEWELGDLGLESTAYGVAVTDNIFDTIKFNSTNPNSLDSAIKAKQIFEVMLEMPADLDDLKKAADAYLLPDGSGRHQYTIYNRTSKEDVLKDLLAWFGGDDLYGTELAHKVLTMLDTPRHFYW